jgi:coatomer subunit beta'
VSWSGTGNLVAITTNDSYYILRFDRDAFNAAVESGADISDEGVGEAFDLVAEISERCDIFARRPSKVLLIFR